MRAGENTAAACGLCRLAKFLSCKDADVAKTLRRRCEPVIKRDFGHTRWRWHCRALSGMAGCRMAARVTGEPRHERAVYLSRLRVSGAAHTVANFQE